MIDKQIWQMQIALATAQRSNCLRRQVGCILFDFRNRILATGYNGPPRGFPHCSDDCPGMHNKDMCLSTHAEINALIQCKDCDAVHTVVCTCFPCFRCLKALLNTGMRQLYYNETYEGYEKNLFLLDQGNIIYGQIKL